MPSTFPEIMPGTFVEIMEIMSPKIMPDTFSKYATPSHMSGTFSVEIEIHMPGTFSENMPGTFSYVCLALLGNKICLAHSQKIKI